jgi:putative glutamine amidotransferase
MKKYIGILADQKYDNAKNCSINQLRCSYINTISKFCIQFNVVPCVICPDQELIDLYVNSFDGFISTGSKSHVSPFLYGKQLHHSIKESDINQNTSLFHNKLFKKAMQKDIPYLGICYGMQSMNVAMGGSLCQNISDISDFNHLLHEDITKPTQAIDIQNDTFLHSITGENKTTVNTSHMQCVDIVGDGFVVNAKSSYDNIIEGIEMPNKKFCIGVQWHPEFLTSECDSMIFREFFNSLQ